MSENTKVTEIETVMLDSFMPFSVYSILHRALPMIDGFKPVQRRILYTMYKRGNTYNKPFVKSQTTNGVTMSIHPHGDSSIYDALVRLTDDHNALGTPYIEGEGSFGKTYSRDSQAAAARYTEARLNKLAGKLFTGIDKGAVNILPSYDESTTEPELLPVPFPTVLTNGISGVAAAVATNIPPFNFHEVISYTIAKMKENNVNILEHIKAPDFPIENVIVYDEQEMLEILNTGRGNFKLRASYEIKGNQIIFHHVPHTTTYESIIDRIVQLKKDGKLTEVVNVHDRTGMNKEGVTTGIEVTARTNTNMQNLVDELFLLTNLEVTYSVNLNIVLDNRPQVLGVPQVVEEWIKFRINSLRSMSLFQKEENVIQLEKLQGLIKIKDRLDEVVNTVRHSNSDSTQQELEDKFNLTTLQAEYVANLQVRSLTSDIINKRIEEIQQLEKVIYALTQIIEKDSVAKQMIIRELEQLSKEFPHPRKTTLVDKATVVKAKQKIIAKANTIDNYNLKLYTTKEGYIKKIPLTSLRGNAENRLKEGDSFLEEQEMTNLGEIITFTNKHNVHKKRLSDIENSRLTDLGEYVPTLFDLEKGEEPLFTLPLREEFDQMVILGFDDGTVVKIDSKAYYTKQNRTLLKGGYHKDKTLIFATIQSIEDLHLIGESSDGYVVVRNMSNFAPKASRTAGGNNFMRLDENQTVVNYRAANASDIEQYTLNSAGRGKKK